MYAQSVVYRNASLVLHRRFRSGSSGNGIGWESGIFSSRIVSAHRPRRHFNAGRNQFHQYLWGLPRGCRYHRIRPYLPPACHRRHAAGRHEARRFPRIRRCRPDRPDAVLALRLGDPRHRLGGASRRLHLYGRPLSVQVPGSGIDFCLFSDGTAHGLAGLVHSNRCSLLAAGSGVAAGRFSGFSHSERQ